MSDGGDPSSGAEDFLRFNCPGCDEEVDVPGDAAGQLVRCPYCNTDFFASPEHLFAAVVDDTPKPSETDREFAISKLRIEQYAALRRGAIRSRSWWVIVQIACLFVTLDAGAQIFVYITTWHRWGIGPTLGILVSLLAIYFGRYARHCAAELQREIDTSALSEPTEPPDFSTLGDGSNMINHFEEIR